MRSGRVFSFFARWFAAGSFSSTRAELAARWLVVALALLPLVGCDCAGDTFRDASTDASDDAWYPVPDLGDVGICDPNPPVMCSGQPECLSWAQSLAPAGTYAHTHCESLGGCFQGDTCFNGPLGRFCVCSGPPLVECTDGEVCVSDTLFGPTRCVSACEGYDPTTSDGGVGDVGPRTEGCDTAFRDPLSCDTSGQAFCMAQATTWAQGRVAHTVCSTTHGGMPSRPNCARGDFCDGSGCRCSEHRACGASEVCVSDTLDGPRRCVRICSGD